MLFTAQTIWINIRQQNEELLSEEKSFKNDLFPPFWVWEKERTWASSTPNTWSDVKVPRPLVSTTTSFIIDFI